MKSIHIILVTFTLSICALVHAQTLKNIHRHNQPVLRIPTHLIDKVETADVQGVPHLRVIQFNGYVSEIPLAQIDSITHSEGEAVDPAQLGNLRTASVMGIVRGPTGAPEMNAIVRSPYGGEETRTDPNGVFFLNDIIVYDNLGYITITKPGFHEASRSFLPLESGSNRVNVQLLPMTESGNFSASSGGTVTSGLLQLNFPANAVTLNGQPYTGTVRVFAAALDPSSPEMFDQMPGELLGGMNDSLRLLRSFGMAEVELRDANMNELQLANGVSATLTFNIPSAMQADAPETIDWWSFDEEQGLWMHEGIAQKQGNQYIGQASHFSWWNCDVPENFNDFRGIVSTQEGDPVPDARMEVLTQAMGARSTYTNSEGAFSGWVPANQNLNLSIFLSCAANNDWYLVYTNTYISDSDPIESFITINIYNNLYRITGTVVDCDGQPIQSGYVKMGPNIFFSNQGEFTIPACETGEYTIQGFNTLATDSIKASDLINVQVENEIVEVGNIEACSVFFGIIMDIEGNVYQTVLIGNQLWMAENLKTSLFSDGSEIVNVTNNTAWSQLTTPAWCSIDNNLVYDAVFGKLYNWFTVADPRNVCPSGWHVPSDSDWNDLTDNLGGFSVAGKKMKSIDHWDWTAVTSTNSSGFTGLPAGGRINISGYFYSIGFDGNWWSSTASSSNNAWLRNMNYNSDSVLRNNNFKQFGFSVRCLKD